MFSRLAIIDTVKCQYSVFNKIDNWLKLHIANLHPCTINLAEPSILSSLGQFTIFQCMFLLVGDNAEKLAFGRFHFASECTGKFTKEISCSTTPAKT